MARVLCTALVLQGVALRLTPPQQAEPLVNANMTMVANIRTALVENLGNTAAALEAVEKLFDGDGAPPLESKEAKFLLQEVRLNLKRPIRSHEDKAQAHFLGSVLSQLEQDTEPEPLESESSGSFLHEFGTSLTEFVKTCIGHRVLRRRSVLSHTFDDKQLRGKLLMSSSYT